MFYLLKRTRLVFPSGPAYRTAKWPMRWDNVPVVFMNRDGDRAWLAGIAGVIVAPYLSVYPGMFSDMILDCFAVIAVGG